MAPYRIFFYTSLLFLIGVFTKSIGLSSAILYFSIVLSFSLFIYLIWNKQYKLLPVTLLPFFILFGAIYYQWDHNNLLKTFIASGNIETEAVVVSNPRINRGVQEFEIKLLDSSTKLFINTRKYPEVNYGDQIKIEGEVEQVDDSTGYGNWLYKNGVVGLIYFPKSLQIVDQNKANKIKYFLYKTRNQSELIFEKLFTPTKAAFINGLTLGGYSGFSNNFREAMERSGTTHLVALSGYNISVLVWVAMAFFLFFFKRRTSIILTLLMICGFVVMTGAEASVIRAAIMGSLIVIAVYFGRFYDLKNALIFAALFMVLFNPKVLVYDVGFQLSFLALLGIVYIKPVLDKLFGFYDHGFLAWKENLNVTASAQIAVFPLLMLNFNFFSLSSIFANVAILELIPITMFLGFFILISYAFLYPVAVILSWIANIFLEIEIVVIELFSSLSIPIIFNMTWVSMIFYYLVIALIVYVFNKKLNYEQRF